MQAKLLLGVALAATITIAIQAELVLVYTINRHGARDFLLKASTLRETDTPGGPSLLPQGQRQCYNAGRSQVQRLIVPGSTHCVQHTF
jgi:hypothetical protein